MLRNNILCLLIVCIIFVCFVAPVSSLGLLASPVKFDLSMQHSQTFTGQITLENPGNSILYVNITKKRVLKDNIHMLFSDEGIAKWISVDTSSFTLNPHEIKTVSFNVTAPQTVDYNDAYGALLVTGSQKPPETNGSSMSSKMVVQQEIVLLVPVIVGLPGKINESVVVTNHKTPTFLTTFMPGSFEYNVTNNGTVHENVKGNIELDGWLSKHNLNMAGSLYPGDNYYLLSKWTPDFFDMGFYDVNTTMNYGDLGDPKTAVVTDKVFVFPIWIIILIVLAVAIWVIRKKDLSKLKKN